MVRIRYSFLRNKSNILLQLVDHKTAELENEKSDLKQKSEDLFQFIESNKILISNLVEEMNEPVNFISDTIKAASSSNDFSSNSTFKQRLSKSQGKIFLIENILSSFIELNSIRNSNYTIKASENNLNHILKKLYLRYIDEFPAYNKVIQFEYKLAENLNVAAFFDAIHFQYSLINLLNYLILLSDESSTDNGDNFTIKITFSTNVSETNALINLELTSSDKFQNTKVHSFFTALNSPSGSLSAGNLKLAHIFDFFKANSFSYELNSENEHSSSILLSIPCTVQKNLSPNSVNISELKQTEFVQKQTKILTNETISEIDDEFEIDDSDEDELEEIALEQQFAKRPRVLCIDDFKPFRILVRESLKNDFDVTECESAQIALEKLRSEPHDIIITDYKMPEMNGIEFTKIVRKDPIFAGIPIIILSGVNQEVHKKEALENGADLFLNKPLPPALLLAQVKSIFEMKKRLKHTISKKSQLYSFDAKSTQSNNIAHNSTSWKEDVMKIISENLSDANFNVSDLADHLNMDRSVLFRKTKKTIGKSPSYIIQEMRIQKAIDMLINDKATISEIAYACGYNSLSYFSQAFKTQKGKSPSEWLNRFEESVD